MDTSALANWAVANLQAQIQVSNAAMAIDHPLPYVIANDQLARVFQNLIGNALKYRAEKVPEIRVFEERAGDQWVFAVRDNGIGFDMTHADRCVPEATAPKITKGQACGWPSARRSSSTTAARCGRNRHQAGPHSTSRFRPPAANLRKQPQRARIEAACDRLEHEPLV